MTDEMAGRDEEPGDDMGAAGDLEPSPIASPRPQTVTRPVLVCEWGGRTIEEHNAAAMLADVMDFGWPGPIETAPRFYYRTEQTGRKP